MRDYEYSDLYFDSHLDKQIKIEVVGTGITIDNSMIELDAFELDEILCSEQELTFGSCEANCVKFTARDMPGSIVGKTIRITETVDGNTDVPFSYGVYKVYSDVPTSDRTKREITAYDAMYDIVNADVKSWYAGLSFPMTLRQFRDSFFAHMGITQKETTLVNDGMTVNKTLVATQTDSGSTITEESTISGKAVIEAICEINGVFGNINRDGEFEYVELEQITNPLYPANDLYPSDDLFPRDPNTISMTGHYITFDYEDFQSKEITQIEIRPADDSAGAIVGTSGNNYVISGNFLVSDKSGAELSQIAANTLSIIRKAAYTPLISSEVVGNPCIELGDPIRFNTTREIVESYVLQRTLNGIQNKRDSIVSPGTETHNQNPNSIRDQIESVQRRTNKLERTADHTLSELSDLDKNTSSRFEQTAEQIQTEVINRQNADNEMSTRITQTADSISQEVTARENADREIKASLELKIDIDDDGTIIALINGSADKIHFNANNMFTVSSPNIMIDENGQVSIGGNFIADTAMYLCYNYASLPGIAYASKINVMDLSGGSFSLYGISSGSILEETYSAVGTSNPILVIGKGAAVIKTNAQFQPSSIYSDTGMFKDFCIPATTGTYGGLLYKCGGGYGNQGIASAGWVKNYVSAVMPSTPDMSNYMVRSVNIISGTASVSYCLRNAYVSSSGGIEFTLQQINTSDVRLKDIREKLDDVSVLYMALVPETFSFKPGMDGYDSSIIHFGVDAQATLKAMENAGLNTNDYCLVFSENPMDVFGDTRYVQDKVLKVDYNEFHGLHIAMIQKQQREIEQLRMDNIELRGEIGILKQKMEELENVIKNKINQS